jgi:hypothetical protein
MEDVGADHGYLICPFGYSRAAEKRAQKAVTIRLLPLEEAEHFNPSTWEKCNREDCPKGLILWDGYPGVSLELVDPVTGELSSISFVYYVGKCDQCYSFHVKCLTCQDLFLLTNEDEHQCKCKLPWFWLSSVEQDEDGEVSNELHVVSGLNKYLTVNRKPC